MSHPEPIGSPTRSGHPSGEHPALAARRPLPGPYCVRVRQAGTAAEGPGGTAGHGALEGRTQGHPAIPDGHPHQRLPRPARRPPGHEWYRDGVDAQTRHGTWSTAKSVISLMVGQSIAAGHLHEDDLLVDLLPELKKDGAYDKITVRHLLDMSSGIDVSEDYSGIPMTGTPRMYLTTDLPNFVKDNRALRFTPGSKGEYRSVDTQLLGQILHRVEGKSVAALLQERIWQPMGAGDDATWNLDREGGTEKSFCCLNATARDFAKIGQLVLDNGRAGDRQIVPQAWIDRLSTPAVTMSNGWSYSAQWWHPSGAKGDFSAVGVYGQYIYVNPAERTVIVKLSYHGTEQDEQETIDAMRDLSHNLRH
ncbi:serine hydrolase domain-containing protein [Streptomyces sp. NBC_00519]|uniref:serine hydrolase domain-containing protein n=1 Tax=Streptomyces sp. NBC_00519 TaxID=2975764 RepID=UPI0030E4EEF3